MPSARSQFRTARRAAKSRTAQLSRLIVLTAICFSAALTFEHYRLIPTEPGQAQASPQVVSQTSLFRRTARLTVKSKSYDETRSHLAKTFLDYETKRFIVLSDARPKWSRRQARLLERTYHQFHRFSKRLGLKPRPLRHKLVCVFFQEYDDYRTFARTHDNVTADWISGYYSPKHDRIVFYNIETNPDLSAANPTEASRAHGSFARPRQIDEYDKAAIATVVHEAVHQLAFHTGVQSPRIQNPLWLSEGLATSFETDRPNESFGPDREYSPRAHRFKVLLEDDKLIPLRELVGYSRMPNNENDTITAVYHQSYALVTWMSRHRKGELRKFMNALADETPGRPTPQRHLEMFEQAFGNVNNVERAWLRHERNNSY